MNQEFNKLQLYFYTLVLRSDDPLTRRTGNEQVPASHLAKSRPHLTEHGNVLASLFPIIGGVESVYDIKLASMIYKIGHET